MLHSFSRGESAIWVRRFARINKPETKRTDGAAYRVAELHQSVIANGWLAWTARLEAKEVNSRKPGISETCGRRMGF